MNVRDNKALYRGGFYAIYENECEDCGEWVETMCQCYTDEVVGAFGDDPFEVMHMLTDMWESESYEDPRTGVCMTYQEWSEYFAGIHSRYIYGELIKAKQQSNTED